MNWNNVKVVADVEKYYASLKTYLVALTGWPGLKGFNCRTILVKATDEDDARMTAMRLSGETATGDVKEVFY